MKSTYRKENWSICFDASKIVIFLNGEKVLCEPAVVLVDETGKYIEIGEAALSADSKKGTIIKAVQFGLVVDFDATVFFLKTVFGKRFKRRFKIPSITATIPQELGNIEERAIRDSLMEISRDVQLVYSSIETNNAFESNSSTLGSVPLKPSTIIVNEIVANARMVLYALIITSVYIGVFLMLHHNDRKPVTVVEWGQSCYDVGAISEDYQIDFEKAYYNAWVQKHSSKSYFQIKGDVERESEFMKWKATHTFDDSTLVKSAQETVRLEQDKLNHDLNVIRQSLAKQDLLTHIKYCLLISIAITILRRYAKRILDNRIHSV